jgi:hypothetical protein
MPAMTDAGGRYLITGLRPGAYTISYSFCGQRGRYLSEWYAGRVQSGVALGDATVDPADAAHLMVMPGIPASLRPVMLLPARPLVGDRFAGVLSPPTGRAADRSGRSAVISGTVRNAAGRGLAGVCVEGMTSTFDSANGTGTFTGPGGRYTLPAWKGRWTVSFANGCGGKYAPQWWKDQPSDRHATDLRVPRSGLAGINARLVAGGTITGMVRAASASGAPLRGVCVQAIGIGRAAGIFQQETTRADGSYRLSGLGTGTYRIYFEWCGSKQSYISRHFPGTVSVTDGKTTAGINSFLMPAATISGTVTAAAASAPIRGICVLAVRNVAGAEFETGATQVTGSQGQYSVLDLAPGKYSVQFTGGCGNSGSFAPQSYNAQSNGAAAAPVAVTAGQHVTGINAAMQPGGTISGKLAYRGHALRGACVAAISQEYSGGLGTGPEGVLTSLEPLTSGLTVTSANGTYRIGNLAPGNDAVAFAGGCGNGTMGVAQQWFAPQGGGKPTWITVPGGRVTSGIGAGLKTGGVVAGVVRDSAGKPLAGICATAFSVPGAEPVSPFTHAIDRSNRAGVYRIPGLATGKYAIRFDSCRSRAYAPSWYPSAGSEASAHAVAVRDGHVTRNVDQEMSAGQPIAGTVTSGAAGKPVGATCIFALDSGGFPAAEAIDGQNGNFRTGHLTPGRYSVDVFPCGFRASSLAAVTRSGVVVPASHVASDVRIRLPLAGSIAGTVLGGNPALATPGVCVEATPKTGHGMAGLGVTGATGGYTMTGLAPGSYDVEFSTLCAASDGGFRSQWFDAQPTQALATPVSVSAGATHGGIGAALVADGGIAGSVAVSGSPAAGVCVVAYPASGGQAPVIAESSSGGSYQISDLAPGTYDVEFTAGCGITSYATQWFSGAATRSAATPVTVSAGVVTPSVSAH